MAYIGKSPVIGNFVKLDAITAVNGQAAYTMQNGGSNFTDYESVNQFLVSLNGTIQAPTDSFTVSGSTLTFASNLATGDVIDFIMVFGNSLSAGTPTDATVSTAKIVDGAVTNSKVASTIITGQTAETSIATDDTVLIHDTSAGALRKMTRANFVSGIGGANTPAFSAYSSGNISITNATETTVVFDSEYYDSASAYNVSDGKFTPQTAGKYFVSYSYTIDSGQDSNLQYAYGYIEKNTTNLLYTKLDHRGNSGRSAIINGSVIADMNGSSDFLRIQLYVYANITGSGFIIEPRGTFSGFKIIE